MDYVTKKGHSSQGKSQLYIFEDNEAVIKMIIKGRSPTMRHVSRTHRVALDWLFDRINLDSKIQIKYIDTKNQLADILTKGNFTRDEWNHLLSLFNITHFSSTVCSAAMAKRIQQESGEERVTAKSRPMMNLTARMPSVVSSSTSSSPEKTWYEYQDPGTSVVVDGRSGQPDRLSPARYSKSDYDRSWSSQEWKSEATAHDRSGKPDKTSWKVTDLLSRLGETPETFTGRILFMSMFNDISCDGKGNEEECVANVKVVKVLAKKFGIGQWSFIGPGSEKKWYSMEENSPQGAWDHMAEEMLLEFAESGHPTFRATTPLSRGILKSKGHGKLSIHFAADELIIETIFRIIVSANQLSLYGAVVNICEEFEAHQDRSGEPDVLMGQSFVLSESKAEVPLQNENPSYHQILWQQ